MIRTALIATDAGWIGGANYFLNLIRAVHALPDRRIELLLYTGDRAGRSNYTGLNPAMLRPVRCLDRWSAPWLARKIGLRLLARDFVLEPQLHRQDIAAAFLAGYFGDGATTPAIGWIADFQHRHLPQFFSARELGARDLEFARICRHCNCIVVSSRSAQQDLQDFSPQHAHKARLLQFVAAPDLTPCRDILATDMERRYGFTGRYFLVPNQFWAHKNHRVIIEALYLLRKSGVTVTVIATGSTDDYRQPGYFDSLQQQLRERQLEDSFKVLGVVPYTHLLALMRDAVAILNPSLFEGWSTSVEEAKSLGKQVVLSDIPVHREQMPAHGRYFAPDDASALAQHLRDLGQTYDAEVDAERMARARAALPDRQRQFALNFQDIVLECARLPHAA